MIRPFGNAQRLAACLLAGVALLLPSCADNGHFTVLGYTTKPNYAEDIRTVRVPIFKNESFHQRLEFDLTREVIAQIQSQTPYLVVACDQDADTELIGVIKTANKKILNRNQLNEIREAETGLTVELIWRKIDTGEILSKPRKGQPDLFLNTPALPAATGPDGLPIPLPPPEEEHGPKPIVIVASHAHFIPELGESITTAYQKNVKRLATQIVSAMEKPW